MIVIKRADGGISIMRLVAADADAQAEIEKWKGVHAGEYVSHRELPDAAVPSDRTFRNAWVASVTPEPAIDIDMPKARDLHRDHLRALRAPLLAALDIEMTRAYKSPARQDEIEAERQALRDATADPAIEAARTAEELKAVLPAALRDQMSDVG